MIKHFCDLCGAQATDVPLSMAVPFPERTWRGTKHQAGKIDPVDGVYTPTVEVRAVFDLRDTPRSVGPFHPDLCLRCAVGILTNLTDELSKQIDVPKSEIPPAECL